MLMSAEAETEQAHPGYPSRSRPLRGAQSTESVGLHRLGFRVLGSRLPPVGPTFLWVTDRFRMYTEGAEETGVIKAG